MHTLVAAVSVAIVVGGALWFAHHALGQWSTLMWAGLGFMAFIGLCRRANA